MIALERRLAAFSTLGKWLEQYLEMAHDDGELPAHQFAPLTEALYKGYSANNWFTIDNQLMALQGIRKLLEEEQLRQWAAAYNLDSANTAITVAVVMAGNIPAVGFHDFLCVLMSGHRMLGKLSSDDQHLLPALAAMLCAIEPDFESNIKFTDGLIKNFDAVIATGSDNTARYFEDYFGRYPHIIRRNRNSLGIIDGMESEQDLQLLASDIFSYFGMGCRSVSHLLLPANSDPENLFKGFEPYRHLRNHYKYFNNYEYHKAISLINRTPHHDNGFVLMMPDNRLSSPVSVLHYSFYGNQQEIEDIVEVNRQGVQCLVSRNAWFPGSQAFGQAQFPRVGDYADGIDTMQFLKDITPDRKK